jgi:LuxR family maltose regulon positive regulatory protein
MAGKTASIAKITRPVLAGYYPRKRLFRLIDKARKRQILWISGPPGSGKTTLVSSYLDARRLPVLWYRMDDGDADPATFFHYLGLAAKKASSRLRKPLPVLTADQRAAITVFARRYFESVFAGLNPGSVIVFDDHQKVPDDADAHALILEGLSLLPEGIRVILISREQPSPPFARLRAAQSLEIIDWKELRLDARETEEIARLRWKGKRLPPAVRDLHDTADGWAAGLVLLLEKTEPGSVAPRKLGRQPPQAIFDYFAGEILEDLEDWVQIFLVKTAHLSRMTAGMAARLTGQRLAGQTLSFLNRHNYFTEVHPAPEPVYEYHPLFRDYLRSRAAVLLSGKNIRRLQAKTAAILEESGLVEEAADVLQEIGDGNGLARIVRKQAPSLVRQGRTATLAEWLERLPAEILGEDPWLLYWRGVAQLSSLPGESRHDFEEAFGRFSKQKNREGTLRAWSGVVDAIVYGPGSLKALDPWFVTLGRMQKKGSVPLPGEIDSLVTCAMIKALSLRRPRFVDMEMWAERAMGIVRASREVSVKFTALLNVAYYRFHSGDFQATGLLLESLREMIRRPEVTPLSRLTIFWLEAAYANANGMHEHCLKTVTEGIELADATGIHLMDHLLAGHGALSSMHRGDPGTAKKFLGKMASSLTTGRPWEAAFYHFLSGWDALNRRDQAQALFHSERCLAICEEVGNPWTEAMAHLQRAFVLHEEGGRDQADRHVRRAHQMGLESGMHFVRFLCRLTEAHFSLLRGDEGFDLSSLRRGLHLGREKGYVDTYLWRPGLLERIASKALEKGIETEYVRDLIRRNALQPDHALPDTAHWPWPLKLYALGGFDVLKEEKPLRFSRKVQHRPLLMLKALVALGGKGVPEEQLTDILWPEAEGDLAHQSFATTLHRLRTMLGNEKAISLRESRVTLDARCCWVDVFAFDSLVARIDAASPYGEVSSKEKGAMELAINAIALYRGPFLAGDPSQPWIVAMRERLRSKFLRVVGFLGRCLERDGRWEEAVSIYRKGLEVDLLAEEFLQRLMVCHQRIGQAGEAMGVYEHYRKTLSSLLGMAPSVETEAIARRIRSG